MSFSKNSISNSISHSFQKLNNSTKLKLNTSLKTLKPEKTIIKQKINFSKTKNSLYKLKLPKINLTNPQVDLVSSLEIKNNITGTKIFEEITKDQKEREKIDNDPEIQDKILGIEKKMTFSSYEEEKEYIKAAQSREFFRKYEIMRREKEEENEIEDLKILTNNLKEEINEIYKKITYLNKQIYDFDLEESVIDYQFIKESNQKIENEINDNKTIVTGKNGKNKSSKKTQLIYSFMAKTMLLNLEKEKKEKKENIEKEKEDLIYKVEIVKKDILEKENEYKKKKILLKEKIQKLSYSYHKKLYEGLDIRNEGLVWIIKAIWNLGENIQMSFFPKFLDEKSIDYLFNIAHKSVKSDNLNNLIEENKRNLINDFQDLNRNNQFKKSKPIFRTSITDKLTRKLLPKDMIRKYKSKKKDIRLENISIKEMNQLLNEKNVFNNVIETKSVSLIDRFTKLKNDIDYEILLLKNQEMERIFKEFLYNDYGEKFHVNIETIIGCLVGENRKEKEMLKFYRMKNHIIDDLKKIQFYSIMSHDEIDKKKKKEES